MATRAGVVSDFGRRTEKVPEMAADAAMIGRMAITRRGSSGANGSGSDGQRATERSPLPEEALDALVTVLDEIRLGRSRSRSELVVRTGLSRAIVA